MSERANARKTSRKSAPAAKPRRPTAKNADTRDLDIREDDQLEEAQLAAWLKQASRLPGWGAA